MRQKLVTVLAFILTAALLTGCAPKGDPDSSSSSIPESTSSQSSSAPSSSSQSEPDSAPDSSSEPAPPAAPALSYDMDSWEWVRVETESYRGKLALTVPSGMYADGQLLRVDSQALPISFFPDSEHSSKVGEAFMTDSTDTSYTLIDANTLSVPLYDKNLEYTLSDDPSLPENTFYFFGKYISYTHTTIPGGYATVPFKATFYRQSISDNADIFIWFFHNVDSTEAKPLFERIVSSVEVLEIYPPQ